MAATRKNLRAALGAACGLIGISGTAARATEVDTAVLAYTEPDRVSAIEAVVNMNHEFASGNSANFRIVYDALTGASASGAVPAATAQTYTRPSGSGSYETPAGETPLDDTFRDTRFAFTGGGTLALNRLTKLSGGLYGSTEHDYTSLGANASLTRDYNKKRTSFTLRTAFFRDTISPEGGRPDPLAEMRPAGLSQPRLNGDGSKDTAEAGLAWTQVLGRATIAQVNYTLSSVTGYQTDPYKIVSQVDPVTGAPVAQLFESRPEDRLKNVLFSKMNHNLGRDIVSLSYRFMTDDWGINSHTVDLTYRWNFAHRQHLQPHLRWYKQGAADFYQRYLVSGETLPGNVSADYRLGDMTAYTVGLKYGRKLSNGRDFSIRAEYYLQTGDGPADPIGDLAGYDLLPDVDAIFIQVGYSFGL